MQHVSLIFVGDIFKSTAKTVEQYIQHSAHNGQMLYFNSFLATKADAETFDLTKLNDATTTETLTAQALQSWLSQHFSENVNISRPGNSSMILKFICFAGDMDAIDIISRFADAAEASRANFEIDILAADYTLEPIFKNDNQDVSAAKLKCKEGLHRLLALRKSNNKVYSLKLVSNINSLGLSLNLNFDAWCRLVGETTLLTIEAYRLLSSHNAVKNQNRLIEAVGLSGLMFDLDYFSEYLSSRTTISVLKKNGLDSTSVNVNMIEVKVNDLIHKIKQQLSDFYAHKVLPLESAHMRHDMIIAKLAPDLNRTFDEIEREFADIVNDKSLTFHQREAILAMLLGLDSNLFTDSTFSRKPVSIEDISAAQLDSYVDADKGNYTHDLNKELEKPEELRAEVKRTLFDNKIDEINTLRNTLRNETSTLRARYQRLEKLELSAKKIADNQRRLTKDGFVFDGIVRYLTPGSDEETSLFEDKFYVPENFKTPSSVDFREMFNEIRNQGSQNACAAFTIAAILEFMSRENPMAPKDLSEAFIYYNARKLSNESHLDNGTSFYNAIKGTMEAGVCGEDLYPYAEEIFSVTPSADAIEQAKKFTVVKALSVEPTVIDIKAAVASGYPVAGSFRIFDSFSNGNRGFVEMPTEEDLSQGQQDYYHGMTIVGYSDDYNIFVVRNSWGPKFGDKGYCYVPYDYVSQYVRSACIITEICIDGLQTTSSSKNKQPTVSFDTSDAAIEAAILKIMIAKEEKSVKKMKALYEKIKHRQTSNLAYLANPNNRNRLIDSTSQRYAEQIDELHHQEQITQNRKTQALDWLHKLKTKQIIWYSISILILLVSAFFIIWYGGDSTTAWIIAGIDALILAIYIAYYNWKWRRTRTIFNEKIQKIAKKTGKLENESRNIAVRLHINGMMLDRTNDLIQKTGEEYRKLHAFNANLATWLNEETENLNSMKLDIKEPFVGILDNDTLDSYFNKCADSLTNGIDLMEIYRDFSTDEQGLIATKQKMAETIGATLRHAVKDFNMSDYLMKEGQQPNYLVDPGETATMLTTLEARSQVFVKPVETDIDNNSLMTILFISTSSPQASQKWKNMTTRYFSQQPMHTGLMSPYKLLLYRSRCFSPGELGL